MNELKEVDSDDVEIPWQRCLIWRLGITMIIERDSGSSIYKGELMVCN